MLAHLDDLAADAVEVAYDGLTLTL